MFESSSSDSKLARVATNAAQRPSGAAITCESDLYSRISLMEAASMNVAAQKITKEIVPLFRHVIHHLLVLNARSRLRTRFFISLLGVLYHRSN